MHRIAICLLAVATTLTPAAAAVIVRPADGPWFCGTGTEDIGDLTIDDDGYLFTDLAAFNHEGDLRPFIDGTTYEVTSGILGDIHHVANLMYGTDADAETLILVEGDGSTVAGTCHRPRTRK